MKSIAAKDDVLLLIEGIPPVKQSGYSRDSNYERLRKLRKKAKEVAKEQDKMWLLDDGIMCLPYGHYAISEKLI